MQNLHFSIWLGKNVISLICCASCYIGTSSMWMIRILENHTYDFCKALLKNLAPRIYLSYDKCAT